MNMKKEMYHVKENEYTTKMLIKILYKSNNTPNLEKLRYTFVIGL